MADIEFRDRADAGARLGNRLLAEGLGRSGLFGILRGGLVVAHHAALITGVQVRAVAASKLRAPTQPELAIGAVTAEGPTYLDQVAIEHLKISTRYLEEEILERRRMAAASQARFGRIEADHLPEIAVVVDDGLATGATAIAAGRLLRELGAARLVVAAPVAPRATLQKLASGEFDDAVCLHAPKRFWAVGQFFVRFEAVSEAQLGELERSTGTGRLPTSGDCDQIPGCGTDQGDSGL
ncbi:MAG: phosphoribosyltransferase [Chloroflexi bacterium]|nr:phosphoribosyltransferase [Chloroflexota bacterium]MYC46747.1 phosphoribosyltransferase [Chloroflexota bacterium]